MKYAQDATSYCKIFNVANNDSDAHLQIIQNGSYSKIKFDNYDLYLSADASGSNVYWATPDTSAYQRWTITQI